MIDCQTERLPAHWLQDGERLQGFPVGHTEACWPLEIPGMMQQQGKAVKDSDANRSAPRAAGLKLLLLSAHILDAVLVCCCRNQTCSSDSCCRGSSLCCTLHVMDYWPR